MSGSRKCAISWATGCADVFRHRPLVGVELARRAAELVERAPDPKRFWDAHVKLMTRSEVLTEDDVLAVASDLGVAMEGDTPDEDAIAPARGPSKGERFM